VTTTVRIWDLPTRLFHWTLFVCVVGSIASASIGGNAIGWHFRFGYAILTLTLFRLLWGFAGPTYARFRSFPPSPVAAMRYLRDGSGERAGHNPVGALSVYAMLAAITFQAATGLFANDSIMWDGPLRPLVSDGTSDFLTRLHRINRVIVILLILLHVGAVVFYRVARGRNLVAPMVSGDAAATLPGVAGAAPARDDAAMRLRALAILAASAAAVWAVLRLGTSGGGI